MPIGPCVDASDCADVSHAVASPRSQGICQGICQGRGTGPPAESPYCATAGRRSRRRRPEARGPRPEAWHRRHVRGTEQGDRPSASAGGARAQRRGGAATSRCRRGERGARASLRGGYKSTLRITEDNRGDQTAEAKARKARKAPLAEDEHARARAAGRRCQAVGPRPRGGFASATCNALGNAMRRCIRASSPCSASMQGRR